MNTQETSWRSSAKKKGQKLLRTLLLVAGTISLVLGAIGIVIPVLPTTPFLLLAAACYYKSSPRMHNWLLNNKYFGEYIRNYREGKGIPLKTKIFALTMLWLTICLSAFLILNILWVQIILIAVAIAVSIHILRLPNFKKSTIEK